MTICFFGRYDPLYSRNRVLLKGLDQNKIKVIECRTDKKGVVKYFDLIKKHWKIRKNYDVMFVAYPGWHAVFLAKILTRKKIVFDVFVSMYDSTVFDRKSIKKESLRAKYIHFMDWFACWLADRVLVDTNEHVNYFTEEFGLKKEKFLRVFVGTSDDVMKPLEFKRKDNSFLVFHHGNIIPLQGVKYILETARLLEKEKDIHFNIISSRIKRVYEKEKFSNVSFVNNVSFESLPEYISKADICVGIFGDTNKTQRVIPNKVYEYAASKKATITADTPAIRELFDDNDLILIPTANPEKLAEAILLLKNTPELRKKIEENAYNKIKQNATPKIVVGKMLKDLNL